MKDIDITLYGATGFTGKLTAEYLLGRKKDSDFKFAIAGRNRTRLEELKRDLLNRFPSAGSIEVIIADSDNYESVRKMAERSRVIVTTVGPYLKYGEPLLRACAEEGTHYTDLTGEGGFVSSMSEKYESTAIANKAKILNCCGYDSIPADLGTYFLMKNFGPEEDVEVECFISFGSTDKDSFSFMKSFSGGTWHSALGFMNIAELDRRKKSFETISSSAAGRDIGVISTEFRFREDTGTWGMPLPFVDEEVVLRSAAKIPSYGKSFRYGHYAGISSTPLLFGVLLGAGAVLTLAQFSLTRKFLYSLKNPGDGPDEHTRSSNTFCTSIIGKSKTKQRKVEVRGGDPGYGDTAKMLGETALCLLKDELSEVYGFQTPASACGDRLLERLNRAGISFIQI